MTRKPANSLRGILTIGTMLPNALLILAAAFLFIISYIKRSGSYDVYLHDTYYIISRQFALQIIALYLALTWIFYATLNKFFTMRLLSWSHTGIPCLSSFHSRPIHTLPKALCKSYRRKAGLPSYPRYPCA